MTKERAIEIIDDECKHIKHHLTEKGKAEEYYIELGDYLIAFELAKNALEKEVKTKYERFLPCLCGCNRRESWSHYETGNYFIQLVCKKCGLSIKGKNHADAKRNWNKYIKSKEGVDNGRKKEYHNSRGNI